jgi:hypothetical protein
MRVYSSIFLIRPRAKPKSAGIIDSSQANNRRFKMTKNVRIQLALNDIRAARGQYANMTTIERQLLINDLVAGRKSI